MPNNVSPAADRPSAPEMALSRWSVGSHASSCPRQTTREFPAGCEQIFIDKASGKLARRPELDKALMVARRGGQLVATKLDRLGRSLEHLIGLSAQLQEHGVDLIVLDQGIGTSTAVGRMFFQILSAIIAEFEHALMSERTRDGLEAARARGPTGGQKAKLTPRQSEDRAGDMPGDRAGRRPGTHRPGHRRRVRRHPAHHLPAPRQPAHPGTRPDVMARARRHRTLGQTDESCRGIRTSPMPVLLYTQLRLPGRAVQTTSDINSTEPSNHRGTTARTVGEAVAAYLATLDHPETVGTRRVYTSTLRQLRDHLGAATAVADVETPDTAARLADWFTGRWGQSAPATFNRNLDVAGADNTVRPGHGRFDRNNMILPSSTFPCWSYR
ncbi:recombinase family protein [Frankia sp. CiP3]|uniref:recombinase family protein n=1 Tax=Frankia sp. CiP3 TaxID=2880971 RepID=UPI001EF5E88B|nr:recombinase family protein [Frankia sp. CiP3]